MANNYVSSIVPAMQAEGFEISHRFGRINDSFELSFKLHGTKIDMFFFYDDANTPDIVWNGGTQARTGYVCMKVLLDIYELMSVQEQVPVLIFPIRPVLGCLSGPACPSSVQSTGLH